MMTKLPPPKITLADKLCVALFGKEKMSPFPKPWKRKNWLLIMYYGVVALQVNGMFWALYDHKWAWYSWFLPVMAAVYVYMIYLYQFHMPKMKEKIRNAQLNSRYYALCSFTNYTKPIEDFKKRMIIFDGYLQAHYCESSVGADERRAKSV